MNPCSIPLAVIIPILMIMIRATSAIDFINSTCSIIAHDDPNVDHALCTTSLQAAPASGCATLRGLGIISIRLVRYNVTDTRCYIKQLIKNGRWDSYMKQCLSDCFELFSDALPSIKQATRYYSMKKFDDANIQITSVMTAATTCEDGFNEKRGVVSPLTKRNNDTFQLSAIVLSIMHMIQTGSG
ncbi:hypothetical protein ACS0TY_003463 [Phlomoides rotata]